MTKRATSGNLSKIRLVRALPNEPVPPVINMALPFKSKWFCILSIFNNKTNRKVEIEVSIGSKIMNKTTNSETLKSGRL